MYSGKFLVKLPPETVNITDIIQYSEDPKNVVLGKLNNKYQKKCYKGYFIQNIVDILEQSSCKMSKNVIAGYGTVNVIPVAEVSKISENQIKLAKICLNANRTLCKNLDGNAAIDIWPETPTDTSLKSLKKDQIVPIIVKKCWYKPMEPSIIVVANLVTCRQKSETYHVNGILKSPFPIEIHDMLKHIKNALVERQHKNQDNIMFFENILYPFKKKYLETKINIAKDFPEWIGPGKDSSTEKTETNILSILKQIINSEIKEFECKGVWSRELNIHLSSPIINISKQTMMKPSYMTPFDIIGIMLFDILNYLSIINDLCDNYDGKKIEKNLNIWEIMRKNQK